MIDRINPLATAKVGRARHDTNTKDAKTRLDPLSQGSEAQAPMRRRALIDGRKQEIAPSNQSTAAK